MVHLHKVSSAFLPFPRDQQCREQKVGGGRKITLIGGGRCEGNGGAAHEGIKHNLA